MVEKSIFDLSGRVALVTGAGYGLGRVFCDGLAEFGADVACADINRDWAEETAAQIGRFGRSVLVIEADVSSPADVERMVDETVARFGRLDILINNAGITTRPCKLHETTLEDWDRLMAINLRGVFLCMKAAIPVMLKLGSGNIINISSVHGMRGVSLTLGPRANYAASKGGVISLTRAAAVDYGGDGIRVNCIAPGWHAGTRLGAAFRDTAGWPEEKQRMIAEHTPLGRSGTPEELKGLAIYLASDASSFVTGQTFVHDGGWTVC